MILLEKQVMKYYQRDFILHIMGEIPFTLI
jgi:hypothetical protein